MFENVSDLNINNDHVSILKIGDEVVFPKGLVLWDYLENVGNSQIDLGFPMRHSYTIEAELQFILDNNNPSSKMSGFLAEYQYNNVSSTQTVFDWITLQSDTKILHYPRIGGWGTSTSGQEDRFVGNDKFKVKVSLFPKVVLYINDKLIYSSNSSSVEYIPKNNSVLFRYTYNNPIDNYGFRGRCYWCKIYDSENNLIRNFIPCTFNNEAGMWDTVDCKFYKNGGKNNFIVGVEEIS